MNIKERGCDKSHGPVHKEKDGVVPEGSTPIFMVKFKVP